ncbi:MAG: CRISPR-associated endonuclease Cas1 [Chthonomonadales bacterium]|nr:CRISPR-associated endonuclease Cas1 [Chthonomonadales bacterium]
MSILYIDEQGAEIHRSGARIIVRKDGQEIRSVRLRDVERLVLFGPVDFTTPAMHALLDAGIETHFLSVDGRYRGRLEPAEGKNVPLRRAQYRRADEPSFCLDLARTILAAKLRNCRYVILRHHRNHPDPALQAAADQIGSFADAMADQPDIDACMGAEGAAARAYFAALGTMVRREFAFTARSRRPPRDPVNALLSFGYALLTAEITGVLSSVGLDAHLGFIHSTQYGRPALTLDILEEFRPVVADRIALRLVNNGILQVEHFEPTEDGGVRMTEEGRAAYLQTYHAVMLAEVANRRSEGRTCFREALRTQAKRMRAAVTGDEPYNPYTPR